ncbi:hypothetical protein M0811_03445 [Anaeramoeba ignava]|uniref:Rho GTPase n=1 Tax=Anaeramoeba ignava TaxID=1746090 RepID=A0A9Q0L4R8_ANAIG|nr:hypothetical protein M0811_03445 [Anaeramoeba ignava]
MPGYKCVFVGDKESKKTEMIITYLKGEYPEKYVPSVFENQDVYVELERKTFQLRLWDTGGQNDYDRLRPLSYPNTNVVLICFSIVNQKSFENVKNKWIPEIQHFCPKVPFILVGTELDKRDDQETINELKEKGLSPITYQQGLEMAKEFKAFNYIECSARKQQNLKEVFQEAVRASRNPKYYIQFKKKKEKEEKAKLKQKQKEEQKKKKEEQKKKKEKEKKKQN